MCWNYVCVNYKRDEVYALITWWITEGFKETSHGDQ